jgi:hypothetical protein
MKVSGELYASVAVLPAKVTPYSVTEGWVEPRTSLDTLQEGKSLAPAGN